MGKELDLSIWDEIEDLHDFDKSLISKKINYIEKKKQENNEIRELIAEKNKRIDMDYVRDSDLIENIVDITVKEGEDIEVEYINDEGEISKKIIHFTTHLDAVNEAITQARKDKEIYKNTGIMPPLTIDFIEHIHELLFRTYILFNTRIDKYTSRPMSPDGYGKFRETVLINGKPHKYNVEVEECSWITPSDSDDVREHMKQLVDKYNNSKLNPILKAIIFKIMLINMQPFRDGNKRTSRIMLNYMLVRNGIPTVTIMAKQKEEYFKAIHDAVVDKNYKPIINLVLNSLDYRCDEYINLIKAYEENKLEEKNINGTTINLN